MTGGAAVQLDDSSPIPPFEQIRAQLESAILVGALPTGALLPTVRQLAADLDVAPNTVGRAYRALEEAGLVRTSGRRGTRVAPVTPAPAPERRRSLEDAAHRYLGEAARLGVGFDEAVAALRRLAGAG